VTVWEVMIERITVVKFRVNYGGGNGAGCFEVLKSRYGRIQRVDLVGWLHTEMVYPPRDGHPSRY